MKRRLFRPALLIGSLLIAGAGLHIAHANVFESAVSAYENEEYAEAIESFREAAEDGNADAQFNLGLMYLKGEGVDEVARNSATGEIMIKVNPEFYRPVDVVNIQGDASKVRNVLGWQPEFTLQDLVNDMCEADFKLAKAYL